MRDHHTGVELRPQSAVWVGASGFEAVNDSPWLKLELDAPALAGTLVTLTYASGWLDPLTRPVLRILIADGHVDEILPGPLFGRAHWIGLIPRGAREIWISPTSRVGPFAFRIEALERISTARIAMRVFLTNSWRGVKFLWGLARGLLGFAESQVQGTLGATSLNQYQSWRASRFRDYEPDFDGPTRAPGEGSHFRFVALVPGLEAVHDALKRQLHTNWSWVDVAFCNPLTGLREEDFVVTLDEAISLPGLALAILEAEAARNPRADLLYADEDFVANHEGLGDPALKPDWSPILQAASPYLGAFVAARARFARRWLDEPLKPGWVARSLAREPETIEVAHVRRVLSTRMRRPAPNVASSALPTRAPLRACVIIPTRDRIDLLAACIASLRAHDAGGEFEIIVVDNDSTEEKSRDYLANLAGERHVRVLQGPGVFNYAALCNRAAKATDARFLLFLNNDVEANESGWLARLLDLAAKPNVGAVGAKMLYPDGKVQHSGVVLGIFGVAGHFERRLDPDSPGYFGPSWAPREVGAVTAACLAVEASKFAAVGGFDDIHLPVEANDVDLCLRLAQRGWISVIEPRARLIHHESASRGVNPRVDPRYPEQVAYFRRHWITALRDDRYYHPALSLESLDVALG